MAKSEIGTIESMTKISYKNSVPLDAGINVESSNFEEAITQLTTELRSTGKFTRWHSRQSEALRVKQQQRRRSSMNIRWKATLSCSAKYLTRRLSRLSGRNIRLLITTSTQAMG